MLYTGFREAYNEATLLDILKPFPHCISSISNVTICCYITSVTETDDVEAEPPLVDDDSNESMPEQAFDSVLVLHVLVIFIAFAFQGYY